jgi:hypothetical protein
VIELLNAPLMNKLLRRYAHFARDPEERCSESKVF